MPYTLNPMTEHQTGAEILGLDLKAPVSDELRSALHADFANADYDMTETRPLYRIIIAGEPVRAAA